MYNDLTLIDHNGTYYVDSRDVAQLVGKNHKELLRDIRRYLETMSKITQRNFAPSDFFLDSSYFDSTGRELPCYLLTKMGCEMVANKLTGEKGILFTAAYVAKFNIMENEYRAKWEQQTILPTLNACNDTAKIIVPQLKRTGASTERILDFLDDLYQPLGICITQDGEFDDIPQTYTPLQMAYLTGMYSMYGNPHAHAVSCILNEHLHITGDHKFPDIPEYLRGIVTGFRYDEHALEAVKNWLEAECYPSGIQTYGRTYHVVYRQPKMYLISG